VTRTFEANPVDALSVEMKMIWSGTSRTKGVLQRDLRQQYFLEETMKIEVVIGKIVKQT
jgi:hypothetical protein